MEKEYTCKKLVCGEYKSVIRLGYHYPNHEHFFINDLDGECFIAGPAADKLYAYEELGYSPEELRKMIEENKRLNEVMAKVNVEKVTAHFDTNTIARSITCAHLPDPKPNPITKVYNMAQMEQYFTDRNIKVHRKWGKCGTDTRYTFTLAYAGVTQDYYFTYPDAVVYEERSKQMTKFCEGAYSCFNNYVRDNVRVAYMLSHVNANRTSLKELSRDFAWPQLDITDLYPSTMIASAPVIKDVIFNDPATIVFWNDGSKTVVRAHGGDKFDPEKGLAMAFAKKMFGNNHDYYIQFKKWLKKAKKGPESKKLEAK